MLHLIRRGRSPSRVSLIASRSCISTICTILYVLYDFVRFVRFKWRPVRFKWCRGQSRSIRTGFRSVLMDFDRFSYVFIESQWKSVQIDANPSWRHLKRIEHDRNVRDITRNVLDITRATRSLRSVKIVKIVNCNEAWIAMDCNRELQSLLTTTNY